MQSSHTSPSLTPKTDSTATAVQWLACSSSHPQKGGHAHAGGLVVYILQNHPSAFFYQFLQINKNLEMDSSTQPQVKHSG